MVTPILNQMVYLFVFMVVGFVLSRWKFVPDNSAKVLSKFETTFFVPAMILNTFIRDCSVEKLKESWQLILLGAVCGIVFLLLSYVVAKLCYKEKYVQNVAVYSIALSNFAFMGYAIVSEVFAEYYLQYILFTLPLWFIIYLWGVPVLLIGNTHEEKKSFASNFKSFLNPMFVALIVGAIISLSGLSAHMPKVVLKIIGDAGFCMSPVAMLLTGATIGKLNLLVLVKKWQVYAISFAKLILFPLLFILVFAFVPKGSIINETFLICGMIFACMPTGLNSIVIPAAYGKDTSDAASMALVTHLLAIGTIPLMFVLFQNLVL